MGWMKKMEPVTAAMPREMLTGWICYLAIVGVNILVAVTQAWWGLLLFMLAVFCIPPLLFLIYWAGR